MNEYTVFNENGSPTVMGFTPIDGFQIPNNWVEGNHQNSYRREDGTIVEKTYQPSPNHIFDYATKQWIDPRTNDTQWPVIRSQRNALLVASDWTQLPDVPLVTKAAWATYRQALRDVTEQGDPFNITWPVAP